MYRHITQKTELQLNLQLNEHKGLFWMKNPISQYGKMYNLVVAP